MNCDFEGIDNDLILSNTIQEPVITVILNRNSHVDTYSKLTGPIHDETPGN